MERNLNLVRRLPRRARMAGFTLVELLTTIVIVSILVAVAVPAFNAQTRKSRRTEARTALLDIASREERLYSTTNTYSQTASDLGYTGSWPQAVGSGYYTVNVTFAAATSTTPSTFTATASPVTGKGQDKDTKCASFQVIQTGAQTATDSGGSTSTSSCW